MRPGVTALLALLLWLALPAAAQEAPAVHVGGQACIACHAAQGEAWRGSHHALAMQTASEATVLGDFAGATLTHFGVTTTFFRDGPRFMVRTDGPDGALAEYPVAYAFGVHPLQQYLIAMPGGRMQALGIAWDSRAKSEGGQRWYHLYPDEKLAPRDRLHWTGRDQTWNHQCASCHSTDLRKNFDLAENSYATRWAEVNVACESCHGPGSRHVAWAQAAPRGLSEGDRKGLVAWLRANDGVWEMTAAGTAKRSAPAGQAELEVCAGCHSRRKVLAEPAVPGTKFMDSFLPAYLEPGLYHADGQIDGEVFEFGSFVQSKMHAAGVQCSNCHEPHSLALRAEGNALCGQCHSAAKFDVASHHQHPSGSAGAQCIACHMPTKTYMGVDVRHDHSFRVPRPDLSVTIGVPNACTGCHSDKPAAWAAARVAEWHPAGRQASGHFGLALHAGRTGARDAEVLLDRLVLDRTQPGIARGTALTLLGRYLTPASNPALAAAIADPDPLVRAAAPRALPATMPPALVRAVAPLLRDPVRAVRIEAARALAGVDGQTLPEADRTALALAVAELTAAEMVDRDQPEAHLNLGLLNLRRQRLAEAERDYRNALRLDPGFVPGLANLADLYRAQGRDGEGAALLRQALALEPGNAELKHSLGLLLVRQRDLDGALRLLREANEMAPENGRFAYVYAIALNSTGARGEALALLRRTHERHPTDANVLTALVSLSQESGDTASTLTYAKRLLTLRPNDAQLRAMVQQMERRLRP